jgi:hypothetical protein
MKEDGDEMKLYCVTLNIEMVVTAPSSREAEKLAIRHASDEVACVQAVTTNRIYEASQVPYEWANALPYGGDGIMTIKQMLTKTEGGNR